MPINFEKLEPVKELKPGVHSSPLVLVECDSRQYCGVFVCKTCLDSFAFKPANGIACPPAFCPLCGGVVSSVTDVSV